MSKIAYKEPADGNTFLASFDANFGDGPVKTSIVGLGFKDGGQDYLANYSTPLPVEVLGQVGVTVPSGQNLPVSQVSTIRTIYPPIQTNLVAVGEIGSAFDSDFNLKSGASQLELYAKNESNVPAKIALTYDGEFLMEITVAPGESRSAVNRYPYHSGTFVFNLLELPNGPATSGFLVISLTAS